ncbi:Endonuclease III-like protein [Mycena venus]|uniref:Endonuclease III homolog n=1 Tax=Mycena venus TaxID=2733690 RepID=A0A8H6Y8N2_9AGAR|nr:Endonuclease III-like protein [Mycena venus]
MPLPVPPLLQTLPRRTKRAKVESSATPDGPSVSGEASKSPLKRASKSPQKSTSYKKALATADPEPPRWREVYACIKKMRDTNKAPVDTMGCHMAQQHETDPKNKRFVTLVSLMLSPQTKDQVTDAAVSKLRTALGGSVSLDAVLAADKETISGAINKVGFWPRKTEYIKRAAEKLRDEFDSDVPKTIEGMVSLPGVGPKIGFLALQHAWGINIGIGVDVHVLRITRLLGWHKADNPEDARISLESWLPTELQVEINPLLVGFGQTICPANTPHCGECDLSALGLCPSAKLKAPKKKKPVAVPDW